MQNLRIGRLWTHSLPAYYQKKSSIDSSYGALRPALWTTTAMMLKSAPMSFEDRSEVMSRLKARLPVFPHYYSKGRERGQIWERQQKRSF